MFSFRNPTRTAAERPVIEIRELTVALLFVHLIANAGLIARALGPRSAVLLQLASER